MTAALARSVDAVLWWVSCVRAGEHVLRTCDGEVYRIPADGLASARFYDSTETFPLCDYPETMWALQNNTVVVDLGDDGVDPAEAAYVSMSGASEMVMHGGADGSGNGWLVEVFTDEQGLGVRSFAPVLRAGVAMALQVPVTAPATVSPRA